MGDHKNLPVVTLVWQLTNRSSNQLANLSLRGIYTKGQEKWAKLALEAVKHEHCTIRAWTERRECNHLYGETMICPWSQREIGRGMGLEEHGPTANQGTTP
jgi:hypothetical protein